MMKKLLNLLLPLGALLGLGYVLWVGVRKQEEKPMDPDEADAAPVAAVEEEPPEAFTVMLEKKRATALGLDKDQPQKMTLQATRKVFGRVLDPSPLVTLDGDLSAAEAALGASKAENLRTEDLAGSGNTSKKNVEAAQAQFLADSVKLQGLTHSAQLQWGEAFRSDPAQRAEFIKQVTSHEVALIRVEVLPGDARAELPKRARIAVLGRETEIITSHVIIPATTTDVKTQAQGFILRVDKPPFTLRPGMALTAWLELPEPPRSGYAVPRSAVLRHDGRTWVYVQEEEEKYVRTAITLDSPLEGDQGWFITEAGGLSADDVVVTTGAASLLSEELKAQGGGEPD
jgi:hypothetical protein